MGRYCLQHYSQGFQRMKWLINATKILMQDYQLRGISLSKFLPFYISSYSVVGAFQLVAFVLIALYSCVYAFRRLTRPGISSEIRFVFIRKHIFYVSVFIFLWTFSLMHLYF